MRYRALPLVMVLLFMSAALAGNGDWFTGTSCGSVSGPSSTECDCNNVDGVLYCSFTPPTIVSGGLEMQGSVGALWSEEEPQLCQGPAVEKEWSLSIEFIRQDGSCSNNRITYNLWTSASASGTAHQLNPSDPQWWWNSRAEFEVDSVTYSWKSDPELQSWTEVPSYELGPQGPDYLSDLVAAGGDAGNPYGIGPNGEQGTEENPYRNNGDTSNNSGPDAGNPLGPHSHTTLTAGDGVLKDKYRDPENLRWTGQGWTPPIEARVVEITVKLKGKAGGTHGDNVVVDDDNVEMWVRFKALAVEN